MSTNRRASHAGSWYAASKKELNHQLETWLSAAQASGEAHGPARAIISPHAGYRYCGPCAAYAFKEIDPNTTKRIFILGPAHHIRLSGCALSPADYFETPLYKLRIDKKVYEELNETGAFEKLSNYDDEEEHSIEMMLAFVAKVMESRGSDNFTIVPIMVGSLNAEREANYGRILAPYLLDPETVFVISSDFCHWGARFQYQYYDKAWGEIHESITKLDKMGMESIETMEPGAFSSYLKGYRNTICGRHPIAVLLNAIEHARKENGMRGSLKFMNYSQSSQCMRMNDSSVSYAAAALRVEA